MRSGDPFIFSKNTDIYQGTFDARRVASQTHATDMGGRSDAGEDGGGVGEAGHPSTSTAASRQRSPPSPGCEQARCLARGEGGMAFTGASSAIAQESAR